MNRHNLTIQLPSLFAKNTNEGLPSIKEVFPEIFNNATEYSPISCPDSTNLSVCSPTYPGYFKVKLSQNQNQNLLQPSQLLKLNNSVNYNLNSPHCFNQNRSSIHFGCEGVTLDQNAQPRPRRRFDEVERLYKCLHPGCGKAYGALNHLNTHILSKNHGTKRLPQEFAAMRRAIKHRNISMLHSRPYPPRSPMFPVTPITSHFRITGP